MQYTMRRMVALLLIFSLSAGLVCSVGYADGESRYSDVHETDWFYQSIAYVSERGFMQGVGAGCFAPNEMLSRAMVVTVLYRFADSPDVSELENPFEDVLAESWYENAVKWAYANQVAYGVSETAFAPNRSITREELACFVIRYAQFVNAGFLTDEEWAAQVLRDEDREQTSPFALEAMETMVHEGLWMGDENGLVHPKSLSTRAVAASTFRMLDIMLGVGIIRE